MSLSHGGYELRNLLAKNPDLDVLSDEEISDRVRDGKGQRRYSPERVRAIRAFRGAERMEAPIPTKTGAEVTLGERVERTKYCSPAVGVFDGQEILEKVLAVFPPEDEVLFRLIIQQEWTNERIREEVCPLLNTSRIRARIQAMLDAIAGCDSKDLQERNQRFFRFSDEDAFLKWLESVEPEDVYREAFLLVVGFYEKWGYYRCPQKFIGLFVLKSMAPEFEFMIRDKRFVDDLKKRMNRLENLLSKKLAEPGVNFARVQTREDAYGEVREFIRKVVPQALTGEPLNFYRDLRR